MSFSGDDQLLGGVETIVVDLAAAWAAEDITTIAELETFADWYPLADRDLDNPPYPDPGSGPATLRVSYSLSPAATIEVTISPGSATPASTFQRPITVFDDGTFAVD